jgi:hypothetical protein
VQSIQESVTTLDARVEEVLPQVGLAFVVDDAARSWGVSRSTKGQDFASLVAGRRVRLQVQAHQDFSVVREYRVLDH